jgi:hypothetical protein
MANLLVHLESFAWQDLTVSRAQEMDDLILAVGKSEDCYDTIYGHPDAYNSSLVWGTVNDLLFCSEEEYRFFTGGWFTYDHQKILLKLWRNPTPNQARTLPELEAEEQFSGNNNGLIGCYFQPLPDKMVFDEDSWSKLHQDYVWANLHLRKTNPSYFYKHYKPALRYPANTINQMIYQKQVHLCFDRLDIPSLDPAGNIIHGEQIGIHFKNSGNACLYIDGTWKHGHHYIIPVEARSTLEEWGFILPPDQRSVD